jgi:hypothetical protein
MCRRSARSSRQKVETASRLRALGRSVGRNEDKTHKISERSAL